MQIVEQKYEKYVGANPYVGFVPFMGEYDAPHSMEFLYFPLNKIQTGIGKYDFCELEKNLKQIASRKHTCILRIYLDYPSLPSGFPEFYFDYTDKVEYDEFGGGVELDWNNPQILAFLLDFIKAFGKKYDGDARIAYLECGLLGHWGEWHTWPHEQWMANPSSQEKIIKQYVKYFKHTLLLARYPNQKFLQKYKVGFHDDSFCFSTKDFLSQMQSSRLTERYLLCPIGGEVRPEEQESLNSSGRSSEDFEDMVNKTHCSWLLNQNAFTSKPFAQKLSSLLGYDFFVSDIKLEKNRLSFTVSNVGVAPLYFDFNLYINFYSNSSKKRKFLLKLMKIKPKTSKKFQIKLQKCEFATLTAENKNSQKINFSNSIKINDEVLIVK